MHFQTRALAKQKTQPRQVRRYQNLMSSCFEQPMFRLAVHSCSNFCSVLIDLRYHFAVPLEEGLMSGHERQLPEAISQQWIFLLRPHRYPEFRHFRDQLQQLQQRNQYRFFQLLWILPGTLAILPQRERDWQLDSAKGCCFLEALYASLHENY